MRRAPRRRPQRQACRLHRAALCSSFADLAANLLNSVVLVSTSQRVAISGSTPTLEDEDQEGDEDGGEEEDADKGKPDSKSPPSGEDFFDDFFNKDKKSEDDPRTVQSLGSGFVIDASGCHHQ